MARPYSILIGNEKGGTGKSTLAMNIIVNLLKRGYRVGSMDLDGKQGTLTSYMHNRVAFSKKSGAKLVVPMHVNIVLADIVDAAAAAKDQKFFLKTLDSLRRKVDFIVIDTPGAQNHLVPLMHTYADLLITPINDSLLDLDVIAKIDADSMKVTGSSSYSDVVWRARKRREKIGLGPLNWFIIKNRLSNLGSKNRRQIDEIIHALAKRMGFLIIDGMTERVVFRELFLKGLTVLDLKADNPQSPLPLSHTQAKQEVKNLVDHILKTRNKK